MYFYPSLNRKYEESSELVDSLILSNAESNELELNQENSLKFFLIFEQNTEVYFNRLRLISIKYI